MKMISKNFVLKIEIIFSIVIVMINGQNFEELNVKISKDLSVRNCTNTLASLEVSYLSFTI